LPANGSVSAKCGPSAGCWWSGERQETVPQECQQIERLTSGQTVYKEHWQLLASNAHKLDLLVSSHEVTWKQLVSELRMHENTIRRNRKLCYNPTLQCHAHHGLLSQKIVDLAAYDISSSAGPTPRPLTTQQVRQLRPIQMKLIEDVKKLILPTTK